MKQFALNKGPENVKNTQVLLFKICTLKKKCRILGPTLDLNQNLQCNTILR